MHPSPDLLLFLGCVAAAALGYIWGRSDGAYAEWQRIKAELNRMDDL